MVVAKTITHTFNWHYNHSKKIKCFLMNILIDLDLIIKNVFQLLASLLKNDLFQTAFLQQNLYRNRPKQIAVSRLFSVKSP